MPLFAKAKKSNKASDEQQTKAETTTAPSTSTPTSASPRPNLPRPHSDLLNASLTYSTSTWTPQRPSNLRASSSSSVRSLPATTRMNRSEPSPSSRGRGGRNDVSIDSVMMSRGQDPSPNGLMVLQTRQPDFRPTMYTYDPSKAPSLSGRKRQYRSHCSKPPTRASSFVKRPHIVTMVEESDETDEQADSSSSSTKSHGSDSSMQSQYLELAKTASNRTQQQRDEVNIPAPEIPARNPARNSISSRRTSVTSNTEPKFDPMSATRPNDLDEAKTPAHSVTGIMEPGPKSKRRNWWSSSSKKGQSGPIETH